MDRLKIGLIGCGTISPVHLDGIDSFEKAELMVVCDIKEAKARELALAQKCRYTRDYLQVLKDDAIDVVHILLPHYLHVPIALDALEHGKHVVLEKPVGISFEQLKQLKEKADNSHLSVGVTLQNRFNPTTVKMKEIVEANELGKFISSKGILTWCRKDSYYSDSDWRGCLAKEGGGLLINQALHTVDLLEYIGGPVKSLKAQVANFTHPEIEVEDTAMISYKYESGAIGSFYGTNSYGENSQIEMGFVFEQGELILRDQELFIVKDGHSELIASDLVKKGNKSYWGMSHQLIIKDIYESILENRDPMVTLDDAIRATELVLQCYNQ